MSLTIGPSHVLFLMDFKCLFCKGKVPEKKKKKAGISPREVTQCVLAPEKEAENWSLQVPASCGVVNLVELKVYVAPPRWPVACLHPVPEGE